MLHDRETLLPPSANSVVSTGTDETSSTHVDSGAQKQHEPQQQPSQRQNYSALLPNDAALLQQLPGAASPSAASRSEQEATRAASSIRRALTSPWQLLTSRGKARGAGEERSAHALGAASTGRARVVAADGDATNRSRLSHRSGASITSHRSLFTVDGLPEPPPPTDVSLAGVQLPYVDASTSGSRHNHHNGGRRDGPSQHNQQRPRPQHPQQQAPQPARPCSSSNHHNHHCNHHNHHRGAAAREASLEDSDLLWPPTGHPGGPPPVERPTATPSAGPRLTASGAGGLWSALDGNLLGGEADTGGGGGGATGTAATMGDASSRAGQVVLQVAPSGVLSGPGAGGAGQQGGAPPPAPLSPRRHQHQHHRQHHPTHGHGPVVAPAPSPAAALPPLVPGAGPSTTDAATTQGAADWDDDARNPMSFNYDPFLDRHPQPPPRPPPGVAAGAGAPYGGGDALLRSQSSGAARPPLGPVTHPGDGDGNAADGGSGGGANGDSREDDHFVVLEMKEPRDSPGPAARAAAAVLSGASASAAAPDAAAAQLGLVLGLRGRMVSYFGKWRGVGDTLMPMEQPVDVFWSWLGAFLSILVVAVLQQYLTPHVSLPLMIASFGASAVLLFGVPASKLAQPRNFLGGQLVSAVVGVAVRLIFTDAPGLVWLSAALGMSLALAAMQLTRTVHPPGGASALIAASAANIGPWHGFKFVLTVLFGCLAMLVVAMLVNNLSSRRRYPTYWWGK